MSLKVAIILTGGTIDSFFDTSKDAIRPYEESRLPHYFKSIKSYLELRFVPVCMKDSRELGKADLEKCLKEIEESDENLFLITHGTYTMPDTSRFLERNLKRKNAVVVLTGAMLPLYGFDGSDAQFNLGFALGSMAGLKAGVYLAMHGRIFKPAEVTKTLSEGRFTSLEDRS